MLSLDECLPAVKSAAIAGHVRPDGDSVGSCLAVYNYISEYYPETEVNVYLEPIPEKFMFLSNSDKIINPKDENINRKRVYDLFIALDCGDKERLGYAAGMFKRAKKTLCVDHHLTNSGFADISEIHPEASSASELVCRMMDMERITKEIAECLYMGIAHDTGIFQYSCTSPLTMEIAGQLMGKGIDYPRIVDETYYVRTYPQQRIWGKALRDSRLFLGGRVICSVVTGEDMEEYGVTSADIEGIVAGLRSTEGVEVAVFLYASGEGYRISMRSSSYVDVARIATQWGGGGHARAAGASSNLAPGEITEKLLVQIEKQLQ
ncbi:MAG: DHH family phosphoesterase [Clostridiales bacterium]|nr:DHH family phosphoesterase [Clostridiales bacterium]